MFGTIFLIVVICIGGLLVAFNTNYFQGSQGLQGIAGINGLDFNSTIPYTFLFNGTQGIQGLTGSSGLISVSSPLFNISGVLSLNQTLENGLISITHSGISDWGSATSSFLTSNYISSVSGSGLSVSGSGQLTDSYLNQAVLTSSDSTFNSLTVTSYVNLGNNIKVTWAGSYWQIGYESPPNYASHVTNSAMVIDVYANANQGFMIRAGTTSLLEISGDGAFFSVPITGKYMSGDYGALWGSISLPSGVNGMQLIAYNSNAGVLASRLYIYTNSAWHWSVLT